LDDKPDLLLDILGLDRDMLGTAEVEGATVAVAGAAPGDRVRAAIEHRSPHRPLAWGRLSEVVSRGASFVEPPCPHAAPLRGRCGGCTAQHLAYATQLDRKTASVREFLGPIAREVRPAPQVLGYRNRAQYAVAPGPEGVDLGAFAPRSRDFVPIPGCLTVRPAIARLAAAVVGELRARSASGPVRWVSIRTNPDDACLIELVAYDESALDPHLVRAVAGLEGVAGVAVSTHAGPGNAVRGGPARTVAGRATLPLDFGGLHFEIGPASFFQLHFTVAEAMAELAAAWAGTPSTIAELYAGVGALGQLVARRSRARALRGYESLPESVELATRAAATNQLEASYEVFDLRQASPPLDADLVLVNPPRRGLDAPVVAGLRSTPPQRLLYMSCDPASLARDAHELAGAGLTLVEVAAFDMLPQTPHVEILARFESAVALSPGGVA
jgi:23S rRNA (uracil1939-C5)-methyltransferase